MVYNIVLPFASFLPALISHSPRVGSGAGETWSLATHLVSLASAKATIHGKIIFNLIKDYSGLLLSCMALSVVSDALSSLPGCPAVFAGGQILCLASMVMASLATPRRIWRKGFHDRHIMKGLRNVCQTQLYVSRRRSRKMPARLMCMVMSTVAIPVESAGGQHSEGGREENRTVWERLPIPPHRGMTANASSKTPRLRSTPGYLRRGLAASGQAPNHDWRGRQLDGLGKRQWSERHGSKQCS